MTDWFCNINNTSGTEDGTSEATGWTDITQARPGVNGVTGGDTIWIKAGDGGATYGLVGSNIYWSMGTALINSSAPAYNKDIIQVIGYAGATSDPPPMGDERPHIFLGRTNGGSFFITAGCHSKHLRFSSDAYDGNNNQTGHLSIENGYAQNISMIRNDDATVGDRAHAARISYGSTIIGCEFEDRVSDANWPIRDLGYDANFDLFDLNEVTGCVFKQKTTSYMARHRSTNGSVIFKDCIFIGDGTCLGFCDMDYGSFTTNAMSTYRFVRCIFYNMGKGFEVEAPNGVGNNDTEGEWQNSYDKISFRQCIFENCGTGVDVPAYSAPVGWASGTFSMQHIVNVSDCIFANNTTANYSGDMNVVNPILLSGTAFIDAPNGDFRLNDIAGQGRLIKERLPNFEMNNIFVNGKFNPRPDQAFIPRREIARSL
jgi:hypothetical protein